MFGRTQQTAKSIWYKIVDMMIFYVKGRCARIKLQSLGKTSKKKKYVFFGHCRNHLNPPNSGNFFGRQKQRFARRTKKIDDHDGCNDNYGNFDDNYEKNTESQYTITFSLFYSEVI